MARDIEEFLRRAAARRKQNQAGGAVPPKAPPSARAPQPPPQAPPKKRLAQEAQSPAEDPYARKKGSLARPKTAQSNSPRTANRGGRRSERTRESIEEHVRRAIVVSDVTEGASNLAKDISQADERLEARLEKFDHSMGSLEGTDTVTDDVTATVDGPDKSRLAVDLLNLFASPKTIRQSILISEILKRPDFDDE